MDSGDRDATDREASGETSLAALAARLDRLWDAAPAESSLVSGGLLVRGTRVGKYVIQRCIGNGSFGIVYHARDTELARDVALKLPRIEVLLDAEKRHRFRREATVAAAFDHPLIVPTYEAQLDGPLPYIASAYCTGPDLSEWLADRSRPASPRAAAAFVAQLADAVQFAHDRGIVHRDIKPGNVLLTAKSDARPDSSELSDHVPRLTDFGLAKLCEAGVEETRGSLLIGTPIYMAPEQLGLSTTGVGPATDVYALGVILFQLLCGQVPFTGASYLEVADLVRASEPPSLQRLQADVPRDLEVVCRKCLEKDPRRRYESAAALAADLRRFIEDRPIQARPASLSNRLGKWSRRHQTLVVTAGLSCALLAAILAASVALVSRSRSQAVSALEETADHLYTSDMTLAYQTWEKGWSDEVQQILDRHRPQTGEPDRRGLEWHVLNDLVEAPKSILLAGHKGAVNEMAVFPDRRRLASVGDDGTLRVWRVADGQQLATMELCDEPLSSVAVSPDGRWVAAGSTTLYLLDMDSPEGARELLKSDFTIESICFRDDGRTLVAGTRYHDIALVTVDGEVLQRAASRSRARTLEYLPRSQEILVTNRTDGEQFTGVVQFWSHDLARVEREHHGAKFAEGAVLSIARASPCEDYVAVIDEYDPRTRIIRRDNGRLVAVTRASRDQPRDLAYAPDGGSIAIGHRNGVLERYRIYHHPDESVTLDERPQVVKAHAGEIRCIRFVAAETVATCGEDGRVVVSNLGTRDDELALPVDALGPVVFQLSPDGGRLFYGNNQEFLIAQVDDRTVAVRRLAAIRGNALDWSPDGARVAIPLGPDRAVGVYDKEGGHVCSCPQAGVVESIAYDPLGETLAFVGDHGLQLYRAIDGAPLFAVPLPEKGWAVDFARSGRRIAVACESGEIFVFDVANRQAVFEFRYDSNANDVRFSPDDKLLATAHSDGTIHFWDLDAGLHFRRLVGHENPVRDIDFTPDGKTLLSASLDKTVRLWSVMQGRSYGVLHRGATGESRVSLSADGRRLAVCLCRADGRPIVLVQDLARNSRATPIDP